MLDLYRIMSTSRNFTELQTIWKGWRDVSGKKMKEKYAEFVELSNQGIKELDLGTCGFFFHITSHDLFVCIKNRFGSIFYFTVSQHFVLLVITDNYLFIKCWQ